MQRAALSPRGTRNTRAAWPMMEIASHRASGTAASPRRAQPHLVGPDAEHSDAEHSDAKHADDVEDTLLFSSSPQLEIFGAFSSSAEFHIAGVAPSPVHIVQHIVNCDEDGPSVLLWNSAVAASRMWWAESDALPGARDRRVLDLGAGLGLNSLTAAALGAQEVVATEVEPALSCLRASVARNSRASERVVVEHLAWGDDDAAVALGARRFDVVIGADLLYAPSLHAPLLQTLQHVLRPGATLVLAYEARAAESAFFDAVRSTLGVEGKHMTADDGFEQVSIFVGCRAAAHAQAQAA